MSVCSWECWLLLWNMKMSTGCDIWESLFSEWIILKWDYHQGADAKRSRSRSVHRHRRQCLLACAYCDRTHINAGQNEALGYYLKCITQRRRCILLESEGCREVSQALSLLWTRFLEIFLATQESQKNINKRMTHLIKGMIQTTLRERLMPLLPLIWMIFIFLNFSSWSSFCYLLLLQSPAFSPPYNTSEV